MTTKRGNEDVSIGVRDGTRLTIRVKSDKYGECESVVIIHVCERCRQIPCQACAGTGVQIERVK
jgi:hypothetical protein